MWTSRTVGVVLPVFSRSAASQANWACPRSRARKVGGDLHRVQHDEVPAAVVEGVVGLRQARPLPKERLASVGVADGRAAFGGIEGEDVVVAQAVVDGQAQPPRLLLVQVVEVGRAGEGDGVGVEDEVAAAKGKGRVGGGALHGVHGLPKPCAACSSGST